MFFHGVFESFTLLFAIVSIANVSADIGMSLTSEEEAALKTVSEGSNKFAIKLYKELIKTESGNVFVSPLSLQMVLALSYTGAVGSTASELKSLLSLPDTLNQTHSGYHSLIKNLQDPALKLANRMFVEKTAKVKEDFQNNAMKYFLAPAEQLDFQGDPEKSREHINLWVENQTNKKITDIIPLGVINSSTRLMLVNAVHFKANWKKQFDSTETRGAPFHVSKTETKQVEMMQDVDVFGYSTSSALKAKILQLHYEGMNFHMIIVLPDEVDGLTELEAKLETVNLFDELKHVQDTFVRVRLPLFNMAKTIDLTPILKSMGVQTMFGDSADFSQLSNDHLVVSKVFQKAFVEVTEKGTEAAAATGVLYVPLSGTEYYGEKVFIADHPFLFATIHKSSNTTLFLGRVTDPK